MKINPYFVNSFITYYEVSYKIFRDLDDDAACAYLLTSSPLAKILDPIKMKGDIIMDLFQQAMMDFLEDKSMISMGDKSHVVLTHSLVNAFIHNMGKFLKDEVLN